MVNRDKQYAEYYYMFKASEGFGMSVAEISDTISERLGLDTFDQLTFLKNYMSGLKPEVEEEAEVLYRFKDMEAAEKAYNDLKAVSIRIGSFLSIVQNPSYPVAKSDLRDFREASVEAISELKELTNLVLSNVEEIK